MRSTPSFSGYKAFGLLAGPALAGLLVFTYGPTLASFALSFYQWDLLGPPQWVGLANYQRLLGDPLFWQVVRNTTWFVVAVTSLQLVLGLAIALALHRVVRGQRWLRLAYFLPYVTPMVAVALVFGWLYNGDQGILNQVLLRLGLIAQPVAWLHQVETALGAVVALDVWKTLGYTVVLLLAGLLTVPPELEEAARLDGAQGWSLLWRVTLPLLSPTLFLVSLLTLIHAMQAFDAVYLLTQGGPQQATTVVVYALYQYAFQFYKVGQASALAYLLFAVILLLTLLQWGLRKHWVLYEDQE